MVEQEKKNSKNGKEDDKPLIEDVAGGISLGDELLDREFRMQERARKIVEEEKKNNLTKQD